MFSEVPKRGMNAITGCSCRATTAELCRAAMKQRIDSEGNLERSNGAKTS